MLVGATVCCMFYTKVKLKSFEQKAIMQNAYMYTRVIEQATKKRSCDTSTHDTTGFTVVV